MVPTLADALKDRSLDVQRNAAEALGKIGDSGSAPLLDAWGDSIPVYNDVEHMKQSTLE